MNITNLAIKKSLTVFVLIFVLFWVGLYAYISLPREAAPDIQIPYIIVNTLYLGVAPADIETIITNPLEKKLKNLKDVKEITSTSGDSISTIAIEFDTDIDIENAMQKVRAKVNQAKKDLPEDAEDPEIIEINISDIPIMVINISGQYDLYKLKSIAEKLKDKIEMVKGILDVTLAGGLEREIQIIADKNLLKKHEVSLMQISSALAAENINIPGGTIDIGRSKYLVRIPGEIEKVKELENIVIDSPNKTPIYLKDLAKVIDTFKEKTTYSRMNDIDSVSLSIQKRSGENVIEIAKEIKKTIAKEKENFPNTTKINIIADQSEDIIKLVNELENSILLGLILVLGVLFFFMGFRNAIFVATAIPFSMLISFFVLQLFGVTLNMVLLFSLILSLGMLVDNAIVIVENIYRYREAGSGRYESAKKATAEVALPVATSTATTIAAFFPLLFIPGIAGEFMKYLPIGVITTISASLFVALIINPVLCANFMEVDKKRSKHESNNLHNKFLKFYRICLQKSLKNRKKAIILLFLSFVISLILFMIFSPGQEFFPDITPSKIYIDLSSHEDATIDSTDQIVREIEDYLYNQSNIKNIITTIGGGQGDWAFAGSQNSPDKARIIVEFLPKEKQTENPFDTIKKIRTAFNNIPGAEIKINKEEMGPPTGAPINIQISGARFETLTKLSKEIKNIISSVKGVTEIKDDFIKGRPEIRIDINRDKAALLKLNTSLIASTIRTAIQGSKVSVYREGTDEYDITLKLPTNTENGIKNIEELTIINSDGKAIPILEITNIKTGGSVGSIQHTNLNRVITVEASAEEGYLANTLLKQIENKISNLALPDGYNIRFTGENEDMQEVADYLQKAFIIAIFLIALILVSHFNSIFLPIIILCSVVFSLIGILLGLVLFRRPFGVIMTGIGIISLAGVVVNNAIVLIDYCIMQKHNGLNRIQAVMKAGAIRLRPVLLTAITTILGLVPMTFGINFDFKYFFTNLFTTNPFSNLWHSFELHSQSTEFWGSMGSAVTIGLAVSTILTLIIVPVLYISLDNFWKNLKNKYNFLKRLPNGS